MANDPRTGRPLGDHGTPNQAIDFAIEHEARLGCSAADFLRCWKQGDLDEFPEFYTWLRGQEQC